MADPPHPLGAQTALQADLFEASGIALRRRPHVRWTDARGAHAVTLEGPVARVGSAPEADLVVADPAVSRLHAELELRHGALWVRDAGSRNGTWLEGILVGAARVPNNGKVRVGGTDLAISYEAVPTPVELWPEERFGPLLGRSAAMRELFARLARLAPTDATVLIQGETGTGKELVAQAIHAASPQAGGPFVVVDCAALPESLLEAELFGHAKGAFTGAVSARAGAFEAADGGTLFLDEVGELPLNLQPKLLRVLESRAVRRLGETAHRKIAVRVLSATHRDLEQMVNEGTLREDLYFRLAVVPVQVPPLRARLDDLELLVRHFAGPHAAPIDAGLLRALAARPWRGNVRELRNFVDRVRALGPAEALAMATAASGAGAASGSGRPSAVPPPIPAAAFSAGNGGARAAAESGDEPVLTPEQLATPLHELREQWTASLERAYLRALLARHGRNVTAVAQASGLNRTYLHRLIRKYEL